MMSSALAGPVIGVEYVAPGLGDQAWVAEEQLSGTGVASRDGMLVPPFRSFFGGERGFEKRQILDEKKRVLLKEHNINLLEWKYTIEMTKQRVRKEVC